MHITSHFKLIARPLAAAMALAFLGAGLRAGHQRRTAGRR